MCCYHTIHIHYHFLCVCVCVCVRVRMRAKILPVYALSAVESSVLRPTIIYFSMTKLSPLPSSLPLSLMMAVLREGGWWVWAAAVLGQMFVRSVSRCVDNRCSYIMITGVKELLFVYSFQKFWGSEIKKLIFSLTRVHFVTVHAKNVKSHDLKVVIMNAFIQYLYTFWWLLTQLIRCAIIIVWYLLFDLINWSQNWMGYSSW